MTTPQHGTVDRLAVSDSGVLQDTVARLVRESQAGDPLAAVTLVVDTPLSGTMMRRQIVASGALGAGVANLTLLTVSDLVAELADAVGLQSARHVPEVVREAVVSAVLADDPGPFFSSRDHPSTALRLGDALAELRWCPLSDGSIERTRLVAPTATSSDVLAFIRRVRSAMETLTGARTDVAEIDDIITGLGGDVDTHRLRRLGALVVVAQEIPAPVVRLLDAAAIHMAVHAIGLTPTSDPTPLDVFDCPDPGTEANLAVRQAVVGLVDGVRPEQVAILYGTHRPYAALLAAELDAAGVTWHGSTATTLGATALARVADVLLVMATGRSQPASGVTRRLMLRWINAAPLHDGDSRLPSWTWRRLIRGQDLFGDTTGWAAALDTLARFTPVEDSADDDADRARAQRGRHERMAQDASSLISFLQRVGATLDGLVEAPTWLDLGARVWDAIAEYHLGTSWWRGDPAERQAHQRLREILLGELPALDDLAGPLGAVVPRPDVVVLQQVLARDLQTRRGRHGDIGTGIHVGPLREATLLRFEHVIVVGASEGLLPPAVSEDPLLPDAVREVLRTSPADLPTSTELVDRSARDYQSVVAAAQHARVTRPRGAVPGRGTPHPSRYLPPREKGASPAVASRWASLGQMPWPVSNDDLAVRALLIDPDDVPEPLAAPATAARAARRGEFDRFHGNITGVVDDLVWDITATPISASGIESFLHCPYHFFVERVLGFSTDEIIDEIDEVAPRDLGTLLHRALDRFVRQAQTEGWLPGPGERWPDNAEAVLRSLFGAEAAGAQAQGLTGWKPAWDARYADVVATFGDLLDKDATQVRGALATAPHTSEVTFGGVGEPAVPVTLDDGSIVHLRGAIDRVDLDADGTVVGVVDYKSGKSASFKAKLGIPMARGRIPVREKVQDLVYDAAARAIYPDVGEVAVRFVFVPDTGEVTVLPADHELDRPATLQRLLDDMRTAGKDARFPPNPRGEYEYCPVCKRLGRRAYSVAADATPTEVPVDGSDEP